MSEATTNGVGETTCDSIPTEADAETPAQEPNNADITVQKEYIALVDLQLYNEEQNLWSGHILPHQAKKLKGASDRDVIYFSRHYDPTTNEMDQVFKEVEFGPELAGIPFTLIPFNKVRIFYLPASIIQLVTPGGETSKIRI